jgi:hypothetical protein
MVNARGDGGQDVILQVSIRPKYLMHVVCIR